MYVCRCVAMWVRESGCSILSSAPKNEMLSDWALIVFVFSLRVLGTHPSSGHCCQSHTHTHTSSANALSVI